jgi:hypothetical protein
MYIHYAVHADHLLVSAVSKTSTYIERFSMSSFVTKMLSEKETRLAGRLRRCMSGVSDDENPRNTDPTIAVNLKEVVRRRTP